MSRCTHRTCPVRVVRSRSIFASALRPPARSRTEKPSTSFDAFVESAWSDHAERPEEVAGRLEDALTLLASPADATAYVRLVVHVYGEHLGQWRGGIALLESVGRNAAWAGSAVVAGAVTRGVAVLRYAG